MVSYFIIGDERAAMGGCFFGKGFSMNDGSVGWGVVKAVRFASD
jgi:hypothetical protein